MQDNYLRQHFPIMSAKVNGKSLIYFDNAATTQKPQSVIELSNHVYSAINANVHRAAHALAATATAKYEHSRRVIQSFIHAKNDEEVIFTSGTTESINLVADSWGRHFLTSEDEVLITHAEHHANIVPWQQLCEHTGATLKIVPLNKFGLIDVEAFQANLSEKTKLVAFHHISNVVGKVNPIKQLTALAKKVGSLVLIDAAQSVAHCELNVQDIDCDFLVFSMHKAFGPTGVGVLYGKKEILEKMPPYKTGGEMIKRVSLTQGTTFNKLPFKFEPGTPNIAGVIASAEAIEFIRDNCEHIYHQPLVSYLYDSLCSIDEVNILFDGCPDVGIFSFTINGHHQQDIAAFFDANGIALRVGHHCAMPLMEYLNIDGCIRASISAYNTRQEVDTFVRLLKAFLKHDSALSEKVTAVQDVQQSIVELFNNCKGWDERHRQIMLLSKRLVRMPSEKRIEDNLIEGCESKAWLTVTEQGDGKINVEADSDAKIIRGLLYIVLVAINGKKSSEVENFDFNCYFEKLGLLQHLSPSRGNGLLAIVDKIKSSVKTS
ncbi:SufS family cysteine desulfurase [Thalassotalea marina]|uniref:cysteine desulfurase n=1 Tax=Thalassotalea marina TaxID=1673741 RepID=A0A919BKN8_9GAMM|nr:SufS family cysteine desulfurase [Thalassotalea marina]GHF96544.1 hypothetical protein GCM10017161_26130 [Thalassotalea marina]